MDAERDIRGEARRSPRAPFHGWVEVLCDGHRARGTGLDLSVDGIGLALPDAACPLEGELVSEFPLPGIALPLEVRGRWAWSDRPKGRGGIRFEALDPGIADLLANFVAGRL